MPRRVHGAYHACLSVLCIWLNAPPQVRAAQGLLSIIHSMKLLLLLSDESQIASRRDQEMRAVQAEKEETKKKVAALLNELLTPQEDE